MRDTWESKTVENKSAITNNFLKTVSAFANFGTGIIQFGIKDDGTVCGIEDPDSGCLDLENKINDCISPKPDFSLCVDRRTNVIILTVREGYYKPYLYKGKAYRRSDTATIEVDRVELNRLILEGDNLYFEELPCDYRELEFSYLEKKLIDKLGISELTDDMLRTFGFYTKDKKMNVAAGLFADNNSYSGIDIARFGESINEIMDRETLCGVSVLKQYDDAVALFKRYYQYEKIEGFDRTYVDIIPESAFREGIANALVHRNWDINVHIKVSMFPDRVEISSPGGLPYGLSAREYLNGNISNLRNPILGNMFFRMHYIEMFGTGIRRIINAYENYVVKPDFDILENAIVVTLPVISQSYAVTTDGGSILPLLECGRILSCSEITQKLGWSKDKTLRELKRLKYSGYIKVVGRGRSTRYAKI